MQVLLVVQAECAAMTKDAIPKSVRIFTPQIGAVTQQSQLEIKVKE